MPAKLSIAFFGMIVGGVAVLIAVIAVYLGDGPTPSIAVWPDFRIAHNERPKGLRNQPGIPYARLQPTPPLFN